MAHADRRPGIRPRVSLGRRLDTVARTSFPVGVTVLLMLLTQAPLNIAAQSALLPAVTLGCVWYWSLVRPTWMPPQAVFLIGLLMDLLGYLPLGVSMFTLLLVHGLASVLHRTQSGRGFASTWLVFSGVAAAASLLIWLLVMALSFRLLSPAPAIFTAALTIAIYPFLAVPFGLAHRSIADPAPD